MVVGCKCIFRSPVWAGKRGWEGFLGQDSQKWLKMNLVLYRKKITFFVCLFLMFGNRTNKLRCSLLHSVKWGFSTLIWSFTAQTLNRFRYLISAAEVCFLCVWLPCFCTILTKEGDLWIGKSCLLGHLQSWAETWSMFLTGFGVTSFDLPWEGFTH